MKKQLCTPRKPATFLKDPEQLFFFHIFNVRVAPCAQDRSLKGDGESWNWGAVPASQNLLLTAQTWRGNLKDGRGRKKSSPEK